MASISERFAGLFGRKEVAIVPSGCDKTHPLDVIINPRDSVSAGVTGERRVIVPLLIDPKPKKPDVVLDERGKAIEASEISFSPHRRVTSYPEINRPKA